MARPQKPVELLELSGTIRADRHAHRQVAPKSELAIGDPPECLAPDEAACWREFIANAATGVLTSGDRWILELAARLQARSRREGLTNGELGCLRACLTELGASPASRGKVQRVGAAEASAHNPWDVPPVGARN